MSLKENIDQVKSELSSEEKFFEKAVMTERFVKKYKKWMIGSVVALVVLVGANIVYTHNNEERILSANEALLLLKEDATNAQALEELKSNSKNLYNLWMYAQAIANKDMATLTELSKSKTPIVSDLAKYEIASDVSALDAYASTQDVIYRDLALVRSAILLIKENKVDKAHQKLQMVSENSSFQNIAKALLHYGVK